MNKIKADEISRQLLLIADGLKFGSVSVTVKIFGGHLSTVAYSKTEQTMKPVKKKDEDSKN